jgi:NAD(P)-dependent dehydrogenase (short-subunit alcohol dehydrogenase family)
MNASHVAHKASSRYPGKRAVITGGASGLGLAMAELLASDGWKLALLDRDAARLADAKQRLAGAADVRTYALDTGDGAAVHAAIDDFAAAHGGLDFALNAAGVAVAGQFLETPPSDWEWIIRINLVGVANSCRAELPHMIASGGGLVINVASAAGFASGSEMSSYNATKAAVISLSETLAQEMHEHKIHVAAAMPGFFRTRLLEHARAPARSMGFARKLMEGSNLEAGPVACELLQRGLAGRYHIVLPRAYRVLWVYKRLAPAAFIGMMTRIRAKMLAKRRD